MNNHNESESKVNNKLIGNLICLLFETKFNILFAIK